MRLILISAAALLAVACSKSDNSDEKNLAKEADHASSGHAGGDVEPGSHADWCGEHGVAESQCTRCNPELAAAFKATGDWCDEHGLPESQCKKCNPDIEIARPPAPDEKVE